MNKQPIKSTEENLDRNLSTENSPIIRISTGSGDTLLSNKSLVQIEALVNGHHRSETNVNQSRTKSPKSKASDIKRAKSISSTHPQVETFKSRSKIERERDILKLLKLIKKNKSQGYQTGSNIEKRDGINVDLIDIYDRLKQRTKSCHWISPVISTEQVLIDTLFESQEMAVLDIVKTSGLSVEQLTSLSLNNDVSSTSITNDLDARINEETRAFEHLDITSTASESDICTEKRISRVTENLTSNKTETHTDDSSGARAPVLPKKMVKALNSNNNHNPKSLHKFNSCTTIFTINNTVHAPVKNPEQRDLILRSVAHAIHCHLARTHEIYRILSKLYKSGNHHVSLAMKKVFKSDDVLSEKLNPIWLIRKIPNEVINHPEIMQPPTYDELFQFLRQIFVAANFTAEIATIMLIYLERMLLKTKINLFGVNCFRSIIGALMLASKIWDDQAVWNVDFKTIISDLDQSGLNHLERWWLNKVDFEVDVKRREFAKYWFEIRNVAEQIAGMKRFVTETPSTKTRITDSIEGILLAPAIKYQNEAMRRKSNLKLDMALNFPKPLTENHIKGISSGESSYDFDCDQLSATSYEFLNATVSVARHTGLKRSQSDFLYSPTAPPASVL